jgi:hypothetical protein
MLPDREWPGRAVTVLEVSLETSDSGLGMYSSVSENPTLFRTTFGVCSGSAASDGGLCSAGETGAGAGEGKGIPFAVSASSSGTKRFTPETRSAGAGLGGALLPLTELGGGTIIEDRSWLEIAAERRWAWPLRGLVG